MWQYICNRDYLLTKFCIQFQITVKFVTFLIKLSIICNKTSVGLSAFCKIVASRESRVAVSILMSWPQVSILNVALGLNFWFKKPPAVKITRIHMNQFLYVLNHNSFYVNLKLEELQGHKVLPVMFHKSDLLLSSLQFACLLNDLLWTTRSCFLMNI